jgi:hypothetical protein
MPKCVPVFEISSLTYIDCIVALADGDDFLLFWVNIIGFCVPSILLVRRPLFPFFYRNAKLYGWSTIYSMRYSRMLEESSFANKKADYFWLLLQSSVMLLVNTFSDFTPILNSNLFFHPQRYYHLYSTYLSYPHPWLLSPSTSGHGDILQRPYLSSA